MSGGPERRAPGRLGVGGDDQVDAAVQPDRCSFLSSSQEAGSSADRTDPKTWLRAFAGMVAMPAPSGFSGQRWRRIIDPAGRFLDRREVVSVDERTAGEVTNTRARWRFCRRPLPRGTVSLWELAR